MLAKGWITPEVLHRALNLQANAGGRLGTCLLDIDGLREDRLVQGLSEQLHVPAVGVEELRGIPEEVLEMVPAKIAARCHAVPFRVTSTQLHIAMLDVRDLAAQDELAFVSGRRLVPHVCSEARIAEALEKCYGVEPQHRMIQLLDRLNRARYLWDTPATPAAARPATSEIKIFESPEAALERPVLTSQPRSATLAGVAPRPVPAEAPVGSTAATSAPVAAAPIAAQAAPIATAPPPAAAAPVATPRPATPTPAAEPPTRAGAAPVISLEEFEQHLLNPRSRDDVALNLLAFLAQQFSRALLFMVRGNKIVGWAGQGPGVEASQVAEFKTDFSQPSVFLNLRQGGNYFLGPLPPMPLHRDLARLWGGAMPKEALVLPVRIKDRLVTLVYCDRGQETLAGVDLEAMQHIAAKVAIAFELCIMRQKLRQA